MNPFQLIVPMMGIVFMAWIFVRSVGWMWNMIQALWCYKDLHPLKRGVLGVAIILLTVLELLLGGTIVWVAQWLVS